MKMLKVNAGKTASLLTEVWKPFCRCKIVPIHWLEELVVPLYNNIGSQADSTNYRPLTILSHARKLTEKSVILDFNNILHTYRVQFVFLAVIQVTQAALSVLAAKKAAASFLAVLDLLKAYNSVIKQLLLHKLRQQVDENLANQILIFILSVKSKVAGEITQTTIHMEKGLTQGGTSSPALFRMFINDLPQAVRDALHEKGKNTAELYPTRLVADDVFGIVRDVESLQTLLDACHQWAKTNKLQWNLLKSQILCTKSPASSTTKEVILGGIQLQWVDEVEYLRIRLSKDGFLGKNTNELEKKERKPYTC